MNGDNVLQCVVRFGVCLKIATPEIPDSSKKRSEDTLFTFQGLAQIGVHENAFQGAKITQKSISLKSLKFKKDGKGRLFFP